MIARCWRGEATTEGGEVYLQLVTERVFPALAAIEGQRGGYVLRRPLDAGVEFLVVTLWDSLEAIRRFAGPCAEIAVVEPDARAVLSRFDERVAHYEVVHANAGA